MIIKNSARESMKHLSFFMIFSFFLSSIAMNKKQLTLVDFRQEVRDLGNKYGFRSFTLTRIQYEKYKKTAFFKTLVRKSGIVVGKDYSENEHFYLLSPLHGTVQIDSECPEKKTDENIKDYVAFLANAKDLVHSNNVGLYPIHLVARNPNQELGAKIVQILKSKGSDINIQGKQGQTPLHEAVFWDNIPVVKALIALGAWPQDCRLYDHPLIMAVKSNKKEMINVLLPSCRIKDVEKAIDIAKNQKKEKIQKELQQWYDAIPVLVKAIDKEMSLKSINILAKQHANFNDLSQALKFAKDAYFYWLSEDEDKAQLYYQYSENLRQVCFERLPHEKRHRSFSF